MKKEITTKDKVNGEAREGALGYELTEFLLYTAPNGEVKVEAFLHNEDIWLTQKRMAELFGVGIPAVSKHLQNIFENGELDEKVVVSILEIPTQHGAIKGKTQNVKTKMYNLDAILSVGYRVNSMQATQFRIWASKVLKEYIIKGFAMDDERMKNGRYFGKDYFKNFCNLINMRFWMEKEKVLTNKQSEKFLMNMMSLTKLKKLILILKSISKNLNLAVNN